MFIYFLTYDPNDLGDVAISHHDTVLNSMTIAAHDEKQAREEAQKNAGAEGKDIWKIASCIKWGIFTEATDDTDYGILAWSVLTPD